MSKNTAEQKTGKRSTAKKQAVDLKEEDLEKIEGGWGTILSDLWIKSGDTKKKIDPTDQSAG